MEKQALEKVNRRVFRKFPEMSGVKPSVRRRGEVIQLIYRTQTRTADGHLLPRRVRVVATPEGKILKMTTSHG